MEEAINTSESVVSVSQYHNFLMLKNKLQIHGLPVGLWNKRMNSVEKSWLCTKNRKIGCGACRKVRTLGMEAKMGMKILKEWASNEITHFGVTREQQLTSLWTKIFKHKVLVTKLP
jgi:hypothetical protein